MSQYYQQYKKYTTQQQAEMPSHISADTVSPQHQQKTSAKTTAQTNTQTHRTEKNQPTTQQLSHQTSTMVRVHKHYNLRANIALVLQAVQQGQSLSSFFNEWLSDIRPQDKGLAHELVFGTLRQWFSLKAIILPLLKQIPQHQALESCLYLGTYQILCTRIAPHASISETVEACKQLGHPYFSGVVNAVLRQIAREPTHYQHELNQTHGLPSWLFKRLKKDWGDDSLALFEQLKQPAPLTLRINPQKTTRQDYQRLLDEHGIASTACQWATDGLVLSQRQNIPQLPHFADGWFSVQDEHAQLCGELYSHIDKSLSTYIEQKVVIDACSAPGGKLTHLLEQYQPKQVFALDSDAQRLEKIQENIQRLQLNHHVVNLITTDAGQWQSPQLADCILLDVPCSATGVIRRHPDIRLLRQAQDIVNLVEIQRNILDNMWQQLRVGGIMLYMTCSLLKNENEQQMIDFFARHHDAKERPLHVSWGIAQQHGRQLLPSFNGGDGFYYCVIEKST